MGFMATGTIKKITEKGITFDQLVEGQTVEFETEKSDRGLRAVRVTTSE
jgi:cold shock protein